ncbi:MAG: MMPL family transporter [Deltaproteobacteria bacterium]|nr:MMPL family transporter [Deltaproteobacteria bacterium]
MDGGVEDKTSGTSGDLRPALDSRLGRLFSVLFEKRAWVLCLYLAVLPVAAYFALKVGQDNSLDRLIVPTDPDYLATRAFQQTFGGGEFSVIMIEADDPFSLPVVERFDRIERGLQQIPHVEAESALSIYRRAKAGFEATPDQVAAFRAFATGTDLLRKQGLVLDHFLAIALVLDVQGPQAREETLAKIDAVLGKPEGPVLGIHTLGLPYVDAYLDASQRRAPLYFVPFVLFVVALNIGLYRSWRTLLAFLITLGVCLALSVGYIGMAGGMFTIVSPMVPMTILVTTTATLVYLHSRFVDCPVGRDVRQHQVFAYVNKFVACTASIFATAVGFAALMVSSIRPVRDMGLWVAVSLGLTWITVFSLFPALQLVLRTPTQAQRANAAAWFSSFAEWLPRVTFRWRSSLVFAALGFAAVGAISIFGFPGLAAPVRVLTDPVEFMRRDSKLYADIQRFTPIIPGMSITQVWLKGSLGSVSEPDVLSGLNDFQQRLERAPGVGAAIGVTNILRMIRYLGGQGDQWPNDPSAVEQVAADLEGLVPTTPMLRRFVQPHELAQTQLTVITRAIDHQEFAKLEKTVREQWTASVKAFPVLSAFQLQTVGLAPLHAKMAQSLVPTLVESFALTVVLIFSTFLLVFRNGTARLMAMIPSLFAILVMFAIMRAIGWSLNIATILIASTVLGTSENDQIHFFYHFLEKRRDGSSIEVSLRHTLLIAGRAIFFATIINAGGFLAFALADLPAVRQFGVLSAVAFLLSMVADFSALPAALWILSRQQPDRLSTTGELDAERLPG